MLSAQSISSFVQTSERKIDELINEALQLGGGIERVELLQKKKARLGFDAQIDLIDSQIEALNNASELIVEQQLQVRQRMESFETQIASVGEATPLGEV